VDWLTAQLPVSSDYQVFTFNTEAGPVLPDTAGEWLEVADQAQLEKISDELRKLVPSGGTSLENAFSALQTLSPAPDNIFLITDGLPTQGATPPRSSKVSGAERQRLYRQAVRKLPRNVPINIILSPMEGDPMAASEFWQLAQVSKGSFMSPSKDWP
ncbi:MAG: VWA domain-containing protein, partial [Pseudomonadota bacterium]